MAVNFGCETQDGKQPWVLRCYKLLTFHGKIKDNHDDLNTDVSLLLSLI